MSGFSWIDVANIEVDSHAGLVKVTLKRNWMYNEARRGDLPRDFADALLRWLTDEEEERP